jgi:hypothetical protein
MSSQFFACRVNHPCTSDMANLFAERYATSQSMLPMHGMLKELNKSAHAKYINQHDAILTPEAPAT